MEYAAKTCHPPGHTRLAAFELCAQAGSNSNPDGKRNQRTGRYGHAHTTLNPTSTPLPLPALTLKPGDFYFSVDGQTSFLFSRNIAGYHPADYDTFLDWSKAGGSKFVRIQLDSLGMGYTKTGKVDQPWASQWDQVFDKAQADGIFILPVFSDWFDWNAGSGYSTWKSNPLNQSNDGPVITPGELFQKGSATQNMWMQWMQSLVKRWQGRKNILRLGNLLRS